MGRKATSGRVEPRKCSIRIRFTWRGQRDTYWKPSLRRCGIRQRRAYCTRHTYATVALMGGVRHRFGPHLFHQTPAQSRRKTHVTFDAIRASALRLAIDKTVSTLGIHSPAGDTITEVARQALLNHLDHLLAQERILFAHVVVLPETKTPPVADTPWYPDDSGGWVEVPDDLMGMPPELNSADLVEVLLREERTQRGDYQRGTLPAREWAWAHVATDGARVVAYKVVKP